MLSMLFPTHPFVNYYTEKLDTFYFFEWGITKTNVYVYVISRILSRRFEVHKFWFFNIFRSLRLQNLDESKIRDALDWLDTRSDISGISDNSNLDETYIPEDPSLESEDEALEAAAEMGEYQEVMEDEPTDAGDAPVHSPSLSFNQELAKEHWGRGVYYLSPVTK